LRRPVWCLALILLAASVSLRLIAQAPAASDLRVLLVGQALIKKDLRAIVPESVASAREYLRGADVVFTNLEASIAPPGANVTPRSATAAIGKPDIAECLRDMGFNLLSLANNHAADAGTLGFTTTRQEVGKLGFGFAGTGANITEAVGPGYMDTRAGKVALVAMASGATTQLSPDTWAGANQPGVNFLELQANDVLNPEQKTRNLDAVREAAKHAGLVIVYQHNHYWGDRREIPGPPGRDNRVHRFTTPKWMESWARELIDAGAHIYVAHGNPALHGVEIYKGRLILYGLGNYIFQSAQTIDRYGPLAWQSVLVDARFTKGRVSAVGFTPLVLAMDGEFRGAPFVAQGGEADAILGRLEDISRPYGTTIRIDKERAEVVLK
jgi:poly-gamma-glutamate capsule biosynthesis protein CapA/YwtB (metallophosphatase superfamily)